MRSTKRTRRFAPWPGASWPAASSCSEGETMSTRREFLRRGGLAVGGLALSPLLGACTTVGAGRRDATVEETTIAALQEAMQAGRLTAESLVDIYVQRIEAIDRTGPTLRSVQEINPDARAIAAALDAERRSRGPRGPLHGIPVLLKDNIATADKLETTAGALALIGARPREDATIARRLREAGAVILGKASMSEWAYFKSAPISATQDTVGPFGRTVADAATVLGALVGVDPRDAATQASAGKAPTDYTRALARDGLGGARIGVPREGYFGYSAKADALVNEAI